MFKVAIEAKNKIKEIFEKEIGSFREINSEEKKCFVLETLKIYQKRDRYSNKSDHQLFDNCDPSKSSNFFGSQTRSENFRFLFTSTFIHATSINH